ncbi:MAG: LytTR family DNA-binding domain-containing protein [Algibacter sp.]
MTCIVIEDEIPAQNILKSFLSKLPSLELQGIFKAAIEAHLFLKSNTVDVIFLDINLPDMSGLDFIKTLGNQPAVIVTSAYPDYAVSSFELDLIVDYLVKPFSFDRFLKATNKLKERIDKPEIKLIDDEDETFFLNVDKTLHKIVVNDILYLESDRNYVTVFTKNQKLSFIDSLKNWNEKLSGKQFIQVHKSFIVNSKRVEKISGNHIFLTGNKIPIGRTYKHDLLKCLGV